MSYPTGNLIPVNPGGISQKIAISGASAQSAAFMSGQPIYVNLYVDTDCFARCGANPTALSDGTDQFIPSGPLFRYGPIPIGYKLAFKTAAGSGFAYITQEN